VSVSLGKAELFAAGCYALGEGPLWFDERWWWTDIEAGTIHSRNAEGGDPWAFPFGQKVTAFAPAENGGLLVAFERQVMLWNRTDGETRTLVALEDEPAENRFNDGKRDPAGRFLIGTLNKAGVRGSASLYSWDPSGPFTRLITGIHLSNGLAWSADQQTLYFVDSLAREVAAFRYDVATGRISNPRVVIKVSPELGLPDGMDIDPEGNLWIAHWGGNAVRCWSPRTGECLREIEVPCSQVTSCHFGGPAGDSLLITSAWTGLSAEDRERQPLAGSVWICRGLL
jgi:sugar lactone lactonase YvrE